MELHEWGLNEGGYFGMYTPPIGQQEKGAADSQLAESSDCGLLHLYIYPLDILVYLLVSKSSIQVPLSVVFTVMICHT